MILRLVLVAAAMTLPMRAQAQERKYAPLPYPEVNADTWVLIEIWPPVSDITLSAYFMDFSAEKNRNLYEATKRILDRDAVASAGLFRQDLEAGRLHSSGK
jgi:hypothetical protein